MITKFKLKSLAVNGGEIAYADSAHNHTILLVHAGGFGSWLDPLADELESRGTRVVRLRRAGYTSGAAPTAPVSVALHATHAAAVIEHLDVGPVMVVGHSSGSVIALQLALDHPGSVRSLVLSEPPLIESLADPADLDLLRERIGPVIGEAMAAAQEDVAKAFDLFMEAVCGPGFRRVITDALGPDGLERAVRESRFFFTNEIMAVGGWTPRPSDLLTIDVPVHLVLGGASPPPVQRLTAHVAAMLGGVQVTSVPGENHLLPLRSPGALADVALREAASSRTYVP